MHLWVKGGKTVTTNFEILVTIILNIFEANRSISLGDQAGIFNHKNAQIILKKSYSCR